MHGMEDNQRLLQDTRVAVALDDDGVIESMSMFKLVLSSCSWAALSIASKYRGCLTFSPP